MRWRRGGILKRMLIEAMVEAFEVFVFVLCFCPLPHPTPYPTALFV